MPQKGAIHCGDHVFTYSMDDNGGMTINAHATIICSQDSTPPSEKDLFANIIATPRVKYLRSSTVVPSHFPLTFWRYKRAVRLIESAVLNPNTIAGRLRLQNEFARIHDAFHI